MPPDSRVHAYDLTSRQAEDALRGQLEGEGWTYFLPRPVVAAARLSLRAKARADAGQVTEALPGEAMELLWEDAHGWAYVRTLHDRYLGWTLTEGLTQAQSGEVLTVTALRAHIYAGPKVSQPMIGELCLGATVNRRSAEVVTEGGRRWVPVGLPGGAPGWVGEATLSPIPEADPAALALRFLDTPYVWGGRSAWGLDCSGLTQLVFGAFGQPLPRDADQQQEFLNVVERPVRGDLAFFPGHVGLMLDERRMVHANATQMRVTIETLGEGDYGQQLAVGCTGFGRWDA
ncbi:NlpC/P60 family protein [Deinococcus arenicola]|uniref:NlpC/P60 family protein n=1 Tax=Deinococcus arenicola TaxID=2994950 RepID=A0ABU4DPI7_9DEIO|nr:NlpC/P60 family protein [Deinococcus sp. ZS9-10]MDV6374024.1 NlpC/P60 family protein [Deinococcus sp. ZS9-10]